MYAHDVGRNRPDLDGDSPAAVVFGGQLDPIVTRTNAADTSDRSGIASNEIAGRACRLGCYQPR